MDQPMNILVLATKLFSMELNVWFVGEGAPRIKLGEQRVSMSYGLPRDSQGVIAIGKKFDLIIVEIFCYTEDLSSVKDAQTHYPNAKIVFMVLDSINSQKLFSLAKEYNAQIEYDIGELARKIRRFFFPEDFKEESK